MAVDLKQVFGSSATTAEGEKDGVAWDEKDEAEPEAEEEEMEMEQSVTVTNDDTSKQTNISLAVPENTESTGFKFSFFGEDEGMETDAAVKKGVSSFHNSAPLFSCESRRAGGPSRLCNS